MRNRASTIACAMLCVFVPAATAGAAGIRILSLVPNETHACVAVPFRVAEDQALTGIRWLNNDGTTPFSRLLLLEGTLGEAPDLTQTGLVVSDLAGGTLEWSETALAFPVTSTTGIAYAVFVFPAGTGTTALGDGGGPGIGVGPSYPGERFYVSADGVEWVGYDPSSHLAVEAVLSSASGKRADEAVALSALKGGVMYRPGGQADAGTPPLRWTTDLQAVYPNPFNPEVAIEYTLEAPGQVRLTVYNVRGQLVRVLAEGMRVAGPHRTVWKGVDEHDVPVASGAYILRLAAAGRALTRRVALVR